jgi:O-antigen/teichoic acid export membrane protein
MNDSFALRFLKGLFFLVVANLGKIGTGIIVVMVAVRFVPKEQYGLYILFLVIISFFVMMSDLGLSISTMKYIATSQGSEKEKIVNSVLSFKLIIIITISAMSFVGKGLIQIMFKSELLAPLLIFIPILLLLEGYDELLSHILQGFQLFKKLSLIQITGGCLNLVMVII